MITARLELEIEEELSSKNLNILGRFTLIIFFIIHEGKEVISFLIKFLLHSLFKTIFRRRV